MWAQGDYFQSYFKFNIFGHTIQTGQEVTDEYTGPTNTDDRAVKWGPNPWGLLNGGLGRADYKLAAWSGVSMGFQDFNVTNLPGSLTMLDSNASPIWNCIVSTSPTNSTLTLPSSTNLTSDMWAGGGQNVTVFGSNTALIHILNDGAGILTVTNADGAYFHVMTNGNYVAILNPSLGPGQHMLLGYGGSNGTTVLNFADTYGLSSMNASTLTGMASVSVTNWGTNGSSQGYGLVSSNGVLQFAPLPSGGGGFSMLNTTNINLTDGTALSVTMPHGLGATPSLVRMVLYCNANDAQSGFTPGQEIEANYIWEYAQSAPAFSVSANATDLFITYDGTTGSQCYLGRASPRVFSSMSNFKLKVYYHP